MSAPLATMPYNVDDTICAIGTAPGGGVRGMVRISGRDAVATVDRIFAAADGTKISDVRQSQVVGGHATLSESASRLPCDLFLWPTTRSYTREPVAELHTVGSPPLLQALVATVCRAGARLAEPGEFTLRAFLAGRVDLTRAEAVLGVIDATDANELNIALAQLAGGLARPLQRLREDLLQLLAELEAGLDFVEEDIEFISRSDVLKRLNAAHDRLASVVQQLQSRQVPAPMNQVVLVGEPNVGKSSLFNAIVRQYDPCSSAHANLGATALVSPQRGTTRDYLTATILLDGIDCELIDTAGIESAFEGASMIERASQELSADRRRRAAVRVGCIDAASWTKSSTEVLRGLNDNEWDVVAITKSDLVDDSILKRTSCAINKSSVEIVATSCRTGAGVVELCRAIQKRLSRDAAQETAGAIAATAERCGESVRLADNAILAASQIAEAGAGEELIASELRLALAELGKVVGSVYTDDLLDRIFRTFCIGK